MSTNATIKIKRKDGTETGIYCHWDGYIEGAGVTLQLAYNTAEKVEKLLKLGDISSLRYYTEPKEGTEHNFEKPQADVCVAYHRDRDEEFRQSNGKNEYIYTFDEEEACWFVEEEKFVNKTPAMQLLYLNYLVKYDKNLLLDRIMQSNIENMWQDDEFATVGNVKNACIKKATEARKKIIEENDAYVEAMRRAYYD